MEQNFGQRDKQLVKERENEFCTSFCVISLSLCCYSNGWRWSCSLICIGQVPIEQILAILAVLLCFFCSVELAELTVVATECLTFKFAALLDSQWHMLSVDPNAETYTKRVCIYRMCSMGQISRMNENYIQCYSNAHSASGPQPSRFAVFRELCLLARDY